MNVEDVYKSLDAKIVLSLQGRAPKDVYERLDRMYNYALEKQKLKKWDEAYMMCKRWNDCVEWLKKKKVDKDIAQKYYSSKKQVEVQRLFKDIKLHIESDFMKRQRQWQAKNKPNNLKNDSSQPKNKNEISCRELRDIMHNDETRRNGVLIIDVRAADVFAAVKMPFQDYMINVDETDILPKKTMSYYTSKLIHNDAALQLFRKRADNDIIVLVDWDFAPLELDTPIAIFRKFLEEYDTVPCYKRIATLKGGFTEWMKKYPELVVRPEITKPHYQLNEIKKQIDKSSSLYLPD